MRALPAIVLAILCLTFATTASAADKHEIILKTGQTAMLEVVETTADSVTVKFAKGGTKGQTKLNADALDPHCFYNVRRSLMEATAENHIRLAIFCATNGLFNRAKYQVQLAEALDPGVVEKIKKMPDVMEKIAAKLAEAAKKAYKAGDKKLALDLASRIATKFPETATASPKLSYSTPSDAKNFLIGRHSVPKRWSAHTDPA